MALSDAVGKLQGVGNAVVEDVASLRNKVNTPEDTAAEQAIIEVAVKLQNLSTEIKGITNPAPVVDQPVTSNMAEPVNPNPEPEHVPS